MDHVIMGKFVGGMCLYIPINRHRGERDSQSFAINSWSFAIRAATVPNRREVLSRVKGRNLFRHLTLPWVVCPLVTIESLSFLFISTYVINLIYRQIRFSFFFLFLTLKLLAIYTYMYVYFYRIDHIWPVSK